MELKAKDGKKKKKKMVMKTISVNIIKKQTLWISLVLGTILINYQFVFVMIVVYAIIWSVKNSIIIWDEILQTTNSYHTNNSVNRLRTLNFSFYELYESVPLWRRSIST